FAVVKLRDLLAVLVKNHASVVARADRVAVGPLENHADARTLIALRLQPADLEHQRLVAVIVNDNLGVGRLASVLVAQSAAIAERRLAQFVYTQPPPRQIHLVN